MKSKKCLKKTNTGQSVENKIKKGVRMLSWLKTPQSSDSQMFHILFFFELVAISILTIDVINIKIQLNALMVEIKKATKDIAEMRRNIEEIRHEIEEMRQNLAIAELNIPKREWQIG
jgi:predicted  nucleic acid-binding Zn-ribbon protein